MCLKSIIFPAGWLIVGDLKNLVCANSAKAEGESDSDSKGQLLFNLNVGWTF